MTCLQHHFQITQKMISFNFPNRRECDGKSPNCLVLKQRKFPSAETVLLNCPALLAVASKLKALRGWSYGILTLLGYSCFFTYTSCVLTSE